MLQEKMGTPADQQDELVRDMVQKYVEGLCWVMAYYYEGMLSYIWQEQGRCHIDADLSSTCPTRKKK